jgi:outer membrane protein assembly factor BamB
MVSTGKRYLLTVLLAMFCHAAAACGGDREPPRPSGNGWPQWRGPGHNGVSPESSGWPKGWPPKRLWSANVGRGCSSPILSGGRLYVMGWSGGGGRPRGNPTGKDTVYGFDARSGRQLWTQSYPSRYQGRRRTGDTGQYGGPSATPSYDPATGRLYTLGVDGDLRCWDTGNGGRLVWAQNLHEKYRIRQRPSVGGGRRDFGFATSPLLHGESVIVQAGDERATVIALDKNTGRRKWTSQYKGPAGHCGGLVPIRVGGADCLAALSLQHLVILRAAGPTAGRTVATYKWQTDYACNLPTPAVLGDRALVTSAYNQHGSELLAVSSGTVRRRWRSKSHALVSSPVLHRGRAFLISNTLRCIDLADGALVYRGGSFGHGSCLVTAGDDKLIVFGKGRLVLLDARPEAREYRELSRVDKVVPGTCYPHIALADGVLCCKDKDGNLVCFSVRPAR